MEGCFYKLRSLFRYENARLIAVLDNIYILGYIDYWGEYEFQPLSINGMRKWTTPLYPTEEHRVPPPPYAVPKFELMDVQDSGGSMNWYSCVVILDKHLVFPIDLHGKYVQIDKTRFAPYLLHSEFVQIQE